MFGLFQKKSTQDPYLAKVAAIIHTTMGPMIPLQNAYSLAAECLGELQEFISNGTFPPGPNPREVVMAYYCLCSMVRESGSSDDKQIVLKISIMASLLASEFQNQQTFTPLEKGICLFGEQTLNEDFPNQSKDDIAVLKRKAADIVYEITNSNGAPISHDDAAKLIKNVSANILETDVFKGGEKVLAISALTSITAYSIDQGEIERSNAYFNCVNAAIKKYVEGQMATFSDYQTKAINSVIRNYAPVVEELMQGDLSKIETKHIAILVKGKSPREVGIFLRKAAIAGSGDSAEFMADILARAIDLKGDEINEKALNDYVFFTELAANCGLSVSQTNLAQHYLKQVTNPIDMAGYDNLKKVEFWLKKAAAQDYEPAIKMLSDLDQLFQWGKDNSNLT